MSLADFPASTCRADLREWAPETGGRSAASAANVVPGRAPGTTRADDFVACGVRYTRRKDSGEIGGTLSRREQLELGGDGMTQHRPHLLSVASSPGAPARPSRRDIFISNYSMP